MFGKHKFTQGKFTPKHPEKFVGKQLPTYRSSWEQRFMNFCDTNPSIKYWASEAIEIPYIHPVTGKLRRYIPDFFIQYQDRTGTLQTELIEVKPKSQTSLKEAGRSKRNQEQVTINEAKWASARKFCQMQNITFRIVTEDDLFHNGKNNK